VAAARAAARAPRAPSPTPELSQIAALRARAEAAEARARVGAAGDTGAAGAAGAIGKTGQAGADAPILDDAAIGKMVKTAVSALVKKVGLPAAFIACLGLGGAGYKVATDKPMPQALTSVELNKSLEPLSNKLDKLTIANNENLQLSKCLRRKVNEIGWALLPAPDRMGPARKPQPYEDDCLDSPKPLPEP
jgi:hypothetical protein